MAYKVKITLADDTVKEFTVGSDVELPTGLNLNASEISLMLTTIEALNSLIVKESWKDVEIEKET